MASLKYKHEYTTDDGTEYVIYIDDADFSGAATAFEVKSPGAKYRYSGQSLNRFNPITALQVTFGFVVTTGTENTFILTMLGADEGRFKIKITKDGVLDFVGFVLNDLIRESDSDRYIFNITATDGLARLKGVDYNDAGTKYTGRETFLGHIFNIFNKFDFDYFYGASDDFLATTVNWWDAQHVKASGTDPLKVSNVDHSIFYTVNRSGTIKYNSCYKVLQKILAGWGCNIRYSTGMWRIYQINEKIETTFPEIIYSSDAAYQSDSSAAYDITIAAPTSARNAGQGGEYNHLAPLRRVQTTYHHLTNQNLLYGQIYDNNSSTQVNVGDTGLLSTGDATLQFGAKLNWTCTFGPTVANVVIIWKLRLQVGTKYLKRTINPTTFHYNDVEWTDDVNDYYVKSDSFLQTASSTRTGTILVNFDVELHPGDILFDFSFEEVFDKILDVSIGGFTLTYEMADLTLKLFDDGTLLGQETSRIYHVNNDLATTNSDVIEMNTYFGDGPFLTSRAKIQTSADGISFVDSTDWKVNDAGTAYDFSNLLLVELLSGRITPAQQYRGSYFGPITAITKVIDSINNYVFQGGMHNPRTGITTGTWFNIVIDRGNTGVTNDEPILMEDPNEDPIIGPEVSSESNITSGQVAHSGIVAQGGPTNSVSALQLGFIEDIIIPSGNGDIYQAGDLIQIVDLDTGLSDTLTVVADQQTGDTTLQVSGYITNNYSANSNIIPAGTQAVIENQLSGEIVQSFFESGALIDDTDFYLKTITKTLENEVCNILPQATAWTVATPIYWWIVPAYYNGMKITQTHLGVKTAGTGSGNNTIDIRLNASTEFSMSLAAAATSATDTTEITLAEGDVIDFDITAITGSTAAGGAIVQFRVETEQETLFQKLQYTLNRIYTTGLLSYQKMNYTPQIPIGFQTALFDASQYIDCGTDPSLNITPDFTISCWVKLVNFTTTYGIAGQFSSTPSEGYRMYTVGTSIRLEVDTQSTCTFLTSNMELDKWHHIAGTYDSTNAKLYLDGELMTTTAYATPPTVTFQEFEIGSLENAAKFNGSLGNLSVWSRALTREELQSIMYKIQSDYLLSENSSLVSHWTLDNLTAAAPTIFVDSYGSSDGTIT